MRCGVPPKKSTGGKIGLYTVDQREQISHVPSGEFARLGPRETKMRSAFQMVLAAAFLAVASVADAGSFEDGQAAYRPKDL